MNHTFYIEFDDCATTDQFDLNATMEIGKFFGSADIDCEWSWYDFETAAFTFQDEASAMAFKLRFGDRLIDVVERDRLRREAREEMRQQMSVITTSNQWQTQHVYTTTPIGRNTQTYNLAINNAQQALNQITGYPTLSPNPMSAYAALAVIRSNREKGDE